MTAPAVLAGALLAICLYAAFAHGAVAAGDEERLQLAVAGVAVVSSVGWLWTGALALRAPRAGWIALGLLAAFACWTGVTLLWSVAPDQTWIECNRAITYLIVLGLAICLGASHPRAPRLAADGFAVVAVLVAAYALAQKLLPGVRVAGVLNLDRTGSLPRLQEPLGYWNALAAFVAMGIAPVLSVVLDVERARRLRLAGTVAVLGMLVTIAFTYSRGALLALAVAAAVVVLGSRGRLRSLMWLGMCLIAAVSAVSAVAPRLAASDADRALVAASGTARPPLRFALARALASSRIDPLSDAGLRAASTIALRVGSVRLARRLLGTAVRRQPTDGQAWQQLTLVYLVLGERADAVLAARRGLALDPRGPLAATVAQRTVLALTPPAGSATSAPAVRANGG